MKIYVPDTRSLVHVLFLLTSALSVLNMLLRRAIVRTHDGPKNHVFPNVYTPYLVLITVFPSNRYMFEKSPFVAMYLSLGNDTAGLPAGFTMSDEPRD